jgi:hypothetical protein
LGVKSRPVSGDDFKLSRSTQVEHGVKKAVKEGLAEMEAIRFSETQRTVFGVLSYPLANSSNQMWQWNISYKWMFIAWKNI